MTSIKVRSASGCVSRDCVLIASSLCKQCTTIVRTSQWNISRCCIETPCLPSSRLFLSFCAQLSGLYLLHKEEIEAAIRQKSCFTLVHLESLLKVIVTLTGMLTMGQQVFHRVRKIALVEGEHSVSVLSPEQMILLLLEALIDGLRLWESAIYLNEPSGNRVSDIPKARAKLDTQTVSRSHCHH